MEKSVSSVYWQLFSFDNLLRETGSSENTWPVCQQMQTDRDRTWSKEVAIGHEVSREASEDLSTGVGRVVKRPESWQSSGFE